MAKAYKDIKAGWKRRDTEENAVKKKKSYSEIKASDYDFGITADDVNSFTDEFQSYMSTFESDYSSAGYSGTDEMKNKYSPVNNLTNKADMIRAYLNVNRESIGEEKYNSLTSYLDSAKKTIRDTSILMRNKLNQIQYSYASEDDYNTAVRQTSYYDKYKDMDAEARADALSKLTGGEGYILPGMEEEYGWLYNYDKAAAYMATPEYGYDKKYSGMSAEERKKHLDFLSQSTIDDVREEYDWLAEYDRQQNLLEYDTEAAREEIARLEKKSDEASQIEQKIKEAKKRLSYADRYPDIIDAEATRREIENLRALYDTNYSDTLSPAEIAEKRIYVRDAENAQALDKYTSLVQNDDFEQYAAMGNAMGGNLVMSARIMSATSLSNDERLVNQMNDDEKKLYSYILAKLGKEEADSYFSTMKPILTARLSGDMTAIAGKNTLTKLAFAPFVGIDQFMTGIASVFDEDAALYPSALQLAGDAVSEDLGGLSRFAYDALVTTANMAPSIITSIGLGMINPVLGQAAGNLLMGTSAGGGAYAEAKRNGYSDKQAESYGILTGASEIALEKVLGGISAFGGNALGKNLTGMIKGLDRAANRIALRGLISAGEEALEEGLQSLIEQTALKNIALGEDNGWGDVEWGDVFYSALLGGITGGIIEGAASVPGELSYGEAKYEAAGQALLDSGNTVFLQREADMLEKIWENEGATSSQIKAIELIRSLGAESSAADIGRAAYALDNARKATNREEISSALEAQGMSAGDARLTAAWLRRTSEDDRVLPGMKRWTDKLTDPESRAYDPRIYEAASRYLYDADSEINQRNQKYKENLSFPTPDEYLIEKLRRAVEDSEDTGEVNEVIGLDDPSGDNDVLSSAKDETAMQDKFKAASKSTHRQSVLRDNDGESVAIDSDADTVKISGEGEYGASETVPVVVTSTGEVANFMRFETAEDGSTVVRLDNGEIAAPSDVSYENSEMASVYEIVTEMGVTAAEANALVDGYTDNVLPTDYALGIREAYAYGQMGMPQSQLADASFAGVLSEIQRNNAFELGRIAGDTAAKNASAAKRKTARKDGKKKRGKVHFDGDKSSLTRIQRTSVYALEKMAEVIGTDIYLFESETDSEGNRKGDNGWYNPDDGSIHIDIYAGNDGKGTILFTASHELTHFIKEYSPEKYRVFTDFLMEQYGKKDVTVDELVQMQIDKASRNGRELTYEQAFDEVIADSCEAMLTDSNAMEKIALLHETDENLWEKIKDFFRNLIARIKSAYDGLEPDSEEAKYVREMIDEAQRLYDLWAAALADAGDVYSHSDTAGDGERVYSFRDSKSGMANDALMPYDDELVNLISQRGNYIIDSYDKLVEIVDEAFDNPNHKATAYFGIVSPNTLSFIQNSIPNYPNDLQGDLFRTGREYSVAVTLDNIRHVVDEKGLSRADVIDYLDRLADTILEFDSVTFDYYYRGNIKIPGLLFKKAFPDGVYISYDLVSQGKKTISMQSLYLDNVDYKRKKSAKTLLMQNTSASTSKTQVGQTSINSISQTDKKSKGDSDISSARDPEALTPRRILANVLAETVQNSEEAGQLQQYKEEIAEIEKLESTLRDQRAQIKEMYETEDSKDQEYWKKLSRLRLEAQKTQNRIAIRDKRLLRLEATKPLQDLLARERSRVRWKTKKKVREKYEKRIAREQLQKLVKSTADWLAAPKKSQTKCPDILRKPYAEFIASLVGSGKDEYTELMSKRLRKEEGPPTVKDQKLTSAVSRLRDVMTQIRRANDLVSDPDGIPDEAFSAGYLDLPKDFIDRFANSAKNIAERMSYGKIDLTAMSSDDCKELSYLIRTLNRSIRKMGENYSNKRFERAEELGEGTRSLMQSLGKKKWQILGEGFLRWKNSLPYQAFKRFGEWGESIFEELMDGQDKLAFHAKTVFDFKEANWTDKEVKAWRRETHTVKLDSGDEITFTATEAMGIFCLSRRKQGRQHLLGGGIRIPGKNKLAMLKTSDVRTELTENDIAKITGELSERQREVAISIQKFMSTVCAGWGNEISMKRFLTKDFTEQFYYPIESNDELFGARDQKMIQMADLYRLLNISATKGLNPEANNAIIIRDIFEVFAAHTSDMAKLNAFGLPLLDYMKWLNYSVVKETEIEGENGEKFVKTARLTLKQAINEAYGEDAYKFLLNLIRDINGKYSDNNDIPFLMGMARNVKSAAVGYNLRVMLLQPTSYTRAATVISPTSLTQALANPKRLKRAYKRAMEYCGIVLWKSFGFYDTNIARQVEEVVSGTKDFRNAAIEWGFKGAEIADALTIGALWVACEHEIAKTEKNIKLYSEEFYKAVAGKLREVIYSTQVVDSVLTRSEIMRSKNPFSQLLSAFRAEPTVSANILMDAYYRFDLERRKTGSKETAWSNTRGYVGCALGAYSVTALVTSLAEALFDVVRDDDEDETFGEKYMTAFWKNFWSNIDPLNKLPFVGQVGEFAFDLITGNAFNSDDPKWQWVNDIFSAVSSWEKIIMKGGSDTTVYKAVYDTAEALSSLTGVGAASALRDIVAIWNKTAGSASPSLKLKKYKDTTTVLANRLYKAILNGKDELAEDTSALFEDDSALQSALAKAIYEHEPEIITTASAYIGGDLRRYTDTIESFVSKGFDEDTVSKAIRSIVSKVASAAQDKADGETEDYQKTFDALVALGYDEDQLRTDIEAMDAAPSDNGTDEVSIFEKEDYMMAYGSSETEMMAEIENDVRKTMLANGKTEEDVSDKLLGWKKEHIKNSYLAGAMSYTLATKRLMEADSDYSENDAYWLLKKWKRTSEHAGEADYSYSKYNDFYSAVMTGENLKTVIKEHIDHTDLNKGETAEKKAKRVKGTLADALASHFKPLFLDADTTRDRANIKARCLTAYAALGYDRDKKNADIDKWLEDDK